MVRTEKILATVLHEAHEGQVEGVTETSLEGRRSSTLHTILDIISEKSLLFGYS